MARTWYYTLEQDEGKDMPPWEHFRELVPPLFRSFAPWESTG